jgi:glutamate racemase
MKIGIFDSGLGGLLVTKSLVKKLPEYDYIYLGDTRRTPYGNRSDETIYQFLTEAVDFLFKKGCLIVIVACNTASGYALRKVQQQYLPKHYPDRRVLGIIIPTAEKALEGKNTKKRIGVLATASTVAYGGFPAELKKIDKSVCVFQSAAPLLVPLIENGRPQWSDPMIKEYLRPLKRKNIDTLILGCTHYPILKKRIAAGTGKNIKVISQNELLPEKLKWYLNKHPEFETRLSKHGVRHFFFTDITDTVKKTATVWFSKDIQLEKVSIEKH